VKGGFEGSSLFCYCAGMQCIAVTVSGNPCKINGEEARGGLCHWHDPKGKYQEQHLAVAKGIAKRQRDAHLATALAQIERQFTKKIGPQPKSKMQCQECWGSRKIEDKDCPCVTFSCRCAFCWWVNGKESRLSRIRSMRLP